MELKISLNESADVAFIKKLLTQIKGIKDFQIINEEKIYVVQESDELKYQLLEKSMRQSDEKEKTLYTPDFLDQIFK